MWLGNDKKYREFQIWSRWIDELPKIRNLQMTWDGFDAFRYNETCSVGAVSNAAHSADFITQLEYSTTKTRSTRGRPHFNGRVDLWIGDPISEFSWALEFKQLFVGNRSGIGCIQNRLVEAMKSARKVLISECHTKFGCLILVPFDRYENGNFEVERMDRLVVQALAMARLTNRPHGKALAWRVGGGNCPIWFLFKEP